MTDNKHDSGSGLYKAPELPDALPADFDKAQFAHNINVKALKVPTKECARYMKLLSKHLLNKPRLKNVLDIPGTSEWRLLLLEEGLQPQDFSTRALLPRKGASTPAPDSPSTLQALIDAENLEVTDATVELGYDDASSHTVLRRLLPAGADVPSSFEQVGHIVHLNLRDQLLPYRKIIGAVLLEKGPKVRTVINKVGNIENEWRVFQMEVLAGDDDTIAEVRQHGLTFKLDFKKVYWNSRLEAEHKRLVDQWFKPGEVVVDAMAGVGPFAVPAGKKGCRVLANDLNPDSFIWLKENIKINKAASMVCAYNMDGRAFMRDAAGGKLMVEWAPEPKPPAKKKKKQGKEEEIETTEGATPAAEPVHVPAVKKEPPQPSECIAIPPFQHIVMNLPATAVEFLDALNGTFDPEMWKGKDLPMVHVYAFLKKDQTLDDLKQRIETALGGPLDTAPDIFSVRDVAPNKQMYCASFRVPQKIAFGAGACNSSGATEGDAGEEAKRQRVN